MAKNTRPLSGQSQRKYFRDLLRADAGVSAEAVVRLTDTLATEVAQIRVRLPLAIRRPAGRVVAARSEPDTVAAPVPVAPPQPVAPAATATEPFDPHAFSLIVILRKAGPEALTRRLAAVADVGRLRAIANAQHVSVDPGLSDLDAVCAAIVAGTQRRIANREAAAS